MSEGTKIGEFKEDNEFNTAVRSEDEPEQDLTATKYGQMSDFEKTLYSEASDASKKETETVENTENNDFSDTEEAKTETIPIQEDEDQPVSEAQETLTSFEQEFEREVESSLVDIQEGDLINGIIRTVEKSGILVDISYKSDGYLANSEVQDEKNKEYKAGDEILVFLEKLESKEGYAILSRKKAIIEEAWNEIINASKNKETVSVKVDSKVQGGLVVSFRGIRGFIPASQVLKDQQAELDNYVHQELAVVVLQADRKRRKVIYSHKLARNLELTEETSSLIENLDIGDICEGKVTSVKDFGVFVDIGGVEGLVHISELSWSRVNHPSEFVNIGDKVRVFVLGVDKDQRKISLGIKQLEPDPWVEISKKYFVGQIIDGVIARIVPFGAFINVEDRLEGLIHISELSQTHIEKVEDVVKEGDRVKARIIKLIPEEQKIGLSLKDLDKEETRPTESNSSESAAEVAEVKELESSDITVEATKSEEIVNKSTET
ncbi:hypothetical protein DID80_00155 [Candidatus Marinamargulisbacteria bacterium SCGC AAA071-K20]|nr:hypothetical protein DID80_00155 [Candidatus Marinamargulisbacteria bacterium SCGC AAA071-K20]